MYQTRAYDDEAGDPVVVIVATGTTDVSRLVHLLQGGSPSSEQRDLADQVTRQVRRRSGGRDALRLLAEHGGPDLLTAVGETKPMFDVAAEVPVIPETGPASAVELAKSYAARTAYAMRYAHETFPKSDHPDRPAALRRASDHIHIAQYMYGVIYLLRELITHAPGQADEIAARLWDDWIDGDGSERLSDWLGTWGIDIDPLIVKAIDDARAAGADLPNADEVAIRQELAAQDAKWGEQTHPNGTGPDVVWGLTGRAASLADLAKGLCERRAEEGRLTWRDILLEEVAEAFAEDDPSRLGAELLQVAALAVQWRRTLRRHPAPTLAAVTAGRDA
ncbi:hypothetical protein ACQP2T_60835 [Nonomuraea sp. CA-143628]|uniref:hypothetical protein n=1 Tax=Nonomuraea sp. CA-143628 TaxID=3239997 RepID=UPI003D8E1760